MEIWANSCTLLVIGAIVAHSDACMHDAVARTFAFIIVQLSADTCHSLGLKTPPCDSEYPVPAWHGACIGPGLASAWSPGHCHGGMMPVPVAVAVRKLAQLLTAAE